MAKVPATRAARTSAIRRVLLGLLIANLAVVGAKVVIGVRTGSLSVLGDAIHSSVDALNNILFMALMGVAGRAPDEEHPYGHGKFEVVGAFSIVIFLSVSCFELLKSVIVRLLSRAAAPQLSGLDLGLLAVTLLVNLWVTWYESRRGRALDSQLLLADAAHTRADVVITLGVIAGALVGRSGVPNADAVVALGITVMIARIGYQIIRRALPILVDERAREPRTIGLAAESVSGVASAYAIRSRASAGSTFAELTIGVEGSMPVNAAHTIADAVEQRLRADLDLDEVVVHIEPC